MRSYAASEIRDVAFFGHGGAGKTTLADSILWCTKTSARLGRVDDDTSTFDYEPEEHKRRSTVSAAVGHVEWKKTKVNLVDTSGHGNFLADTILAADVVDGAVLVVSAPDGVQVYTERAWALLDERELPRAVFVGKIDRDRADWAATVEDIRRRLSDKCVPVELPLGEAGRFEGVIDLLSMKALRFPADGREVVMEEIPAEHEGAARAARDRLEEAVASADDKLIEEYLESGKLVPEDFASGFVRAVRSRAVVPILVGSPSHNAGVQPLLDLIVSAFPSPVERGVWKGFVPAGHGERLGDAALRAPDDHEPVAAYVWKTVNADIGRLSYLRVLSGKLTGDSHVVSANHDKPERVGQLYSLQGRAREPIAEAHAGDLVAVAKLKATKTGDTLADEKKPFLVPRPTLPDPVITYAIRPRSKGDEDKLGLRLADLTDCDPSLKVTHDAASKEVLLGGAGQIHIEVAVERLHRAGVDVELLPPHVPYLETIQGAAKGIEGKHKKQTGGKGQYAVVYLDVEALPRGQGFVFEDAVVGGAVPRQFIPSVEKGVRARMARGVVAGFPVADVKVRLYDGKYHDVDSDSRSFEIAASKGFQLAFKQARPSLLEPIMHLEVSCPDEFMGEIVSDLNHRRGRVEGMEQRGKAQLIRAHAPMAELLRYASDLRSITGGRGTFTMTFSRHDELPAHLAEKVIAEAKLAHDEDE